MGRHKKVMCKVCYREMRSDVLDRHMKQHLKKNESNPVTNIYVTNNYNTTSGVSTERKDEENENEETQYFYFCLDCEKQHCDCGSSSFNNPRFPLSINISKHIEETNHMNFVPIDDKANVKMSNISFSPEYNKVVIKKWKRMVLDGDIKEVQYSTPRKCKKCSLSFVDAIDMFKHIKVIHIHKQSSTVKEKKAFQLLPLEILDLLISFLKPEDILMLRDCLPRVQHCPRFKRLVNKTSWFNIALKLWDMGCMKVVDTS